MACSLLPISEFSSIADNWDAINRQNGEHPLLEARFFEVALRHLGSGSERLAVCDTGENCGPLAILTRAGLGAWSTFQPSQAPLGAFIQCKNRGVMQGIDELLSGLPLSGQMLSLTQLDPDLFERPADHRRLNTLDYIETARITVDQSFEDYWSSRGKNLRHNMKRQANRLEREGTVARLELLTRAEEMAAGVRQYGELESKGWKAEGGTAIHPDNEQGQFYTDLLERYAVTDNARIYKLFYDDRLVAVDLCVINSTMLVILKTTYDETIRTSSPALMMRYQYLPAILDKREVSRIEFYGKVMEWHTKWSDEMRSMYHVNAYRNALLGGLHRRRRVIV